MNAQALGWDNHRKFSKVSGNRSQGTVPISRRERRSASEMALSPRKWDCPPGWEGDRSMFSANGWTERIRPLAEKWTSPLPPRERLRLV